MPAFLVRSNLSRGDLQLLLSNRNGYAQDAASVRWTVYARDGKQVSGRSLPAVKRTTGSYYAPWFTDVPNGNYKVCWEVTQEFGGPTVKITDFIFVVDPAAYPNCTPINESAVPAHGQFTFLCGQALGPGDLPLFLKNSADYPQNAYSVFWTILDVAGNSITPRTFASNNSVGVYYASWFVGVGSGNYSILWEWQSTQASPLKSRRMPFSVVAPGAPFSLVVPILCSSSLYTSACGLASRPILAQVLVSSCDPCPCGPCFRPSGVIPCPSLISTPSVPVPPPNQSCPCNVSVPRAIHLNSGPLPPSGNFTNQAYYLIPQLISNITFFVTYTRGSASGYPILRLRWGNGVDEATETIIDSDIQILNTASAGQNVYLQDLDGPKPIDGNPVTSIIEASVPGGASTVRLIAAEGGVPGAPGTIGITLTASS